MKEVLYNKKINIVQVIKVVLLSLLVFFIGFYYVSQKENLDIDEIYTYGLANSSFQLNIEDFKEYSGSELLSDYATVKSGEEFNIRNVFFNQEMDTHPPLYYVLVNAICSIKKNSFSIWYGLIINVILLVVLFWEMRYLLNLIINDKIYSSIFAILSFFLYGFINEIVFTRMYIMLSVISMSFIILIIKKIYYICEYIDYSKNQIGILKNDFAFLLLYFVICLTGVLTQYHFVFIASFFSIVFAIILLQKKKYKLLIFTFVAGILSLIVSFLIFPGIINHLFGKSSLHALTNDKVAPLVGNLYEILITIKTAFFGEIGLIIYIIFFIILVLIILLVKRKSSSNLKFIEGKKIKLYICILTCCIYYYILISFTVQFSFMRYLYNIYPLITIVLFSPIYLMLKNIAYPLKFFSILLILVLCVTTNIKKQADSLNIGDEFFHQYLAQNKNVKTILLYRSVDMHGRFNTMSTTSKWKLPYPLYLLRDMQNVTFVDISNIEKVRTSVKPSINNHNDIILGIYTTEADGLLINELMQKNNVKYSEKLYFTNYIHFYRLHN